MYVIKNNETSRYVSWPGSRKSYTSRLEYARVFKTKDAAKQDCCGNETAVLMSDLIYH